MMRFYGSRTSPHFASAFTLLLIVCLVVAQSGCGGGSAGGPERYDVSGNVAFDGQPVPFGRIIFQPDTTAGNSGPQGFADIRDGKYNTAEEGKGTVGGAQLVRITAYSADPSTGSEESPVPALFPQYETKADIPQEESTVDFNVPAEAATAKTSRSGPSSGPPVP